ncbi:MAG: M23 family metallopeptidase [Firmicutes bacterium]|nr:M23 family metallopeptidase [Bacillota bacterium]
MIKLMKTCCIVLAVLLAGVTVYATAGESGGSNGFVTMTAEAIGDLRNIDFTAIEDFEGLELKGEERKAFIDDSTGYAIMINGDDLVYLATEEEAQAVIDGIIGHYQTPGSEIIEYAFDEEVTYEELDIITAEEAEEDKTVTETYLCKVDEAINYIINGTAVPLTYTVQGGDTLWDIAIAHDMSVYELEEMNPGASKFLAVGRQINLYQTNPFVHLTIKEKVTDIKSIPYDIAYTYTEDLYKGQVQVQSVGQTGSKEVTAEITKKNGVEIANNVLSETVLSEPVTQIALAGTSTIAVQTGSGQLQFPLAYIEISSPYGSRGGGFHRAVDLRAPRGTDIMAADDGTVIKAGWEGTYGLLIVVDHGNGMVTKYAHCESIAVTIGQDVQKGEVIGAVGITGNATGYHLHFEVIENGVAKNPMNYL